MSGREDLKSIPSVDEALRHLESAGALDGRPRPIVARAVRAALDRERRTLLAHDPVAETSPGEAKRAILSRVEAAVERTIRLELGPVINATGIVVHTNLGRAPLSSGALDRMRDVAEGYSNVEYDLNEGRRGKRDLAVRDALCELCGVEDALVVNNNAAAVLLALNTLAAGREVLVSRSELIEIGGSFRLPDVFEKSGSRMVEVGTTNRTRIVDFEGAMRGSTAAILSAHWSNYEIVGFVERVALHDLAALAERYGIPLIHDLGSGVLVDPERVGLRGEMTVTESVRAGATVATFSGDKLLGGPQAGVAVGSADVIARMRANPLTRALRPGKLTLAALQATLRHYMMDTELEDVPVLRMLAATSDELGARAERLARVLAGSLAGRAEVRPVELKGRVGGGAAPERELESRGIEVEPANCSAGTLASRLIASSPPVIARTRENRLVLDLRTVPPDDDALLESALDRALGAKP